MSATSNPPSDSSSTSSPARGAATGHGGDISRVLLSEAAIQDRIAALGAQIAGDYRGRDLLVVGVLSGSFLFIADLVRRIELPMAIDFISVSSYGDRTRSSGEVRMLKDLNQPITGRDVLLIEDIIDTGLTLSYLIDSLRTRHPASLEIATLLDKKEARVVKIDTAYVGFTCPNEFVVGYGLDYRGRYRNLPYIGVLRPEIYASGEGGEA
ncbi:MAG: hypoxanthine phosphoribosyltransferase [Nannocystaceae bacterium]